MQLVTFKQSEAEAKIGVILNEKIVDLSSAHRIYLKNVGKIEKGHSASAKLWTSMIDFLELGDSSLKVAQEVANYALKSWKKITQLPGEKVAYELGEVKMRAPVPCPRNYFGIAVNYESHSREVGAGKTERPVIFMKPPSTTVIGPGDPIILPEISKQVDYEVELAVIVGKTGRSIPVERALDYVAGYSVTNDISARDISSMKWRDGRCPDWFSAKAFDTSAPLGPCLALKDQVGDPHNLRITLKLNGETVQDSRTGEMYFKIPEIINFISTRVTLQPGDVIATGTPAGTGRARGRLLKNGDVMECEVEKIGVLKNPVKAP